MRYFLFSDMESSKLNDFWETEMLNLPWYLGLLTRVVVLTMVCTWCWHILLCGVVGLKNFFPLELALIDNIKFLSHINLTTVQLQRDRWAKGKVLYIETCIAHALIGILFLALNGPLNKGSPLLYANNWSRKLACLAKVWSVEARERRLGNYLLSM
jgi:hypothetical protein